MPICIICQKEKPLPNEGYTNPRFVCKECLKKLTAKIVDCYDDPNKG